jgi:hypothetical protein
MFEEGLGIMEGLGIELVIEGSVNCISSAESFILEDLEFGFCMFLTEG